MLIYNQKTEKVEELSLLKIGEQEKWFVTQKDLRINHKASLFSGALRPCYEVPAFLEYFENVCMKGYSIRYSSCALLDCFQIFIK